MTVAHEFGHALDCALGGGVYLSGVDPRSSAPSPRRGASSLRTLPAASTNTSPRRYARTWKSTIPLRHGPRRHASACRPSTPRCTSSSPRSSQRTSTKRTCAAPSWSAHFSTRAPGKHGGFCKMIELVALTRMAAFCYPWSGRAEGVHERDWWFHDDFLASDRCRAGFARGRMRVAAVTNSKCRRAAGSAPSGTPRLMSHAVDALRPIVDAQARVADHEQSALRVIGIVFVLCGGVGATFQCRNRCSSQPLQL